MSEIEVLMEQILSSKKVFHIQLIAYEILSGYAAFATLKTVSSNSNNRLISCAAPTAKEALEKMIEKLNDNRDE